MMLPRKSKPPKMGVRILLQRVWPRHRRWVKSHGCCVSDCYTQSVDFAHLRSAANAGTGLKPHDMFGVSLCRLHHAEQHRLGANAFSNKYGIDLRELAAEFFRCSPDRKMRFNDDLGSPRYDDAPDVARA
jgi:hypothetical protein